MDLKQLSLSMPMKTVTGSIPLPGSKSECNRALIIQALAEESILVKPISAAEDTQILQNLLAQVGSYQLAGNFSLPLTLDVGPAGTVMRFLTAFLTVQTGSYIVTGSKRMKERPIKILVEALQSLGADITYLENTGFPPIQIGEARPQKNIVSIKGDISSQYISALLMIAPLFNDGLTLEIVGELTSKPYVNMTLQMMNLAGINYQAKFITEQTADIESYTKIINKGNKEIAEVGSASIQIDHQNYKAITLAVEPDWSAASYWFSLVALSETAVIILPGLLPDSLQGDSAIVKLMKPFGVSASFEEGGLRLNKCAVNFSSDVIDLKECPDLAQTVIVCAAALGQNLSFTGLETLRIKETDRIAAIQIELAKISVKLFEENGIFTLNTSKLNFPSEASFETYYDHRMAMAFAPLALRIGKVNFDNAEVIIKSYPSFWNHLEMIGFQIN